MIRSPRFTGVTLDRAAEVRRDQAAVARLLADPRARFVGGRADGVLLSADADREPELLRLPLDGQVNPQEPILLGLEGGRPLFAADMSPSGARALSEAPGVGQLVSLREAGMLLSQAEGGLAAYLVALLNWHRGHRFCANCGSATRVVEAGISRHCLTCMTNHFPRTDPVVIMLVEHEGRILLGRRVGWDAGRFSILAGFIATGETPEEAVIREVKEEAGITVHSPRYVAAQPWPFPSSLMLGFEATAEGGNPVPEVGEMLEVRWVTRDEVVAAQEDVEGIRLPGEVSIARVLIDAWVMRNGRRL